jgi:hypothetical protein
MSLTKEAKQEIVRAHGANNGDTGSTKVQVALLTHQRPDAASARTSEGPLLATRAVEARRAQAAVPELPSETGSGGV